MPPLSLRLQPSLQNQMKDLGKTKQLPLVYPIVYYVGPPHKKGFVRDLLDCFAQPDLARQYFLKPFHLIDLNQFSDEDLLKDKALAGLQMIQRHIYERDLTRCVQRMLEEGVFVAMKQIGSTYLYSVLKYAVKRGELKNPEQFFEQLTQQIPEDSHIMTIAQHYEQKGLQQGYDQGYLEARTQLAKNLLKRNFDLKVISQLTQLSLLELQSLRKEVETEIA